MAHYTIFSDDSGSGGHQYHSLTLVAVPTDEVPELHEELTELIQRSGTDCTEWKKFGKQQKYTTACKALLGVTPTLARERGVKFQTLLWDLHDPRHQVSHRDDKQNKEYMYRVAFVDLIKRNSITDITWHPDTEWRLDFVAITTDVMRKVQTGPCFDRVVQSSPEESPFLQIADLCSGLWRSYYEKHSSGSDWLRSGKQEGCPSCSWTKREVEQYELMMWYAAKLREQGTTFDRLNEKLKTTAYGSRDINIWPYIPQHPADRAPQRRTA